LIVKLLKVGVLLDHF